jgi:hypothetical protein
MLMLTCLLCAGGLRTPAQDVPGPAAAPWRPIPELPTLLWYTEFDENPAEAKKLYERGVIKKGKPNAENDSMMSPNAVGGDNKGKEAEFFIKINTTPARFPDKLNPNHVFIQFNVWSNEPGRVDVWARANVGAWETLTVPRANQWCPVKVALGSLSDKGDRIKPDALVSEIHLKFKPSRAGDKLPEVYFDKLLVTQGPPEQVAMMLMAWQAKMSKLSKTIEADGFCYDDKAHTTLQKLAQHGPRRGSALIFLPTGGNGNGDDAAQWNTAATEMKIRNAKFEVAQDPRKMPLSDLDDVRAFLPYLMKSDVQAAILVVTRADGDRLGKEVDGVRVILDRLLAAKCIPILCLPAADTTDKKLTEFLQESVKLCGELGVPYADQGFAFKNVPNAYANGKLTAEGEKALCGLLVGSYKHVQEALNPKGR